MIAHIREIGDVDAGKLTALLCMDLDPFMALFRLRRAVAREIVPYVLLFTGQETVPAIGTFRDIGDEIPLFHGNASLPDPT